MGMLSEASLWPHCTERGPSRRSTKRENYGWSRYNFTALPISTMRANSKAR